MTTDTPDTNDTPTECIDTEPPIVDMEGKTVAPEEELQTIKLGDQYDECLLGATINGRFAYSLKRLVAFEVAHRGIKPEEARQILGQDIMALFARYGANGPEFIDDELMPDPEEPRIVKPGDPVKAKTTGGGIITP